MLGARNNVPTGHVSISGRAIHLADIVAHSGRRKTPLVEKWDICFFKSLPKPTGIRSPLALIGVAAILTGFDSTK